MPLYFSLLLTPAAAQKAEIGIYAGQWQPHATEHQKTVSLFSGSAHTTPYFSFSISESMTKTFFLKQTIGYWRQKKVSAKGIDSVTLIPVTLAVKHRLVPDAFFMPCVTYGAGLVFGIPHSDAEFPETLSNVMGFDIFVGTGFDIALLKSLGFHVNFSYHYVKFPSPVGDTDDFTGPRGIFGFFFRF